MFGSEIKSLFMLHDKHWEGDMTCIHNDSFNALKLNPLISAEKPIYRLASGSQGVKHTGLNAQDTAKVVVTSAAALHLVILVYCVLCPSIPTIVVVSMSSLLFYCHRLQHWFWAAIPQILWHLYLISPEPCGAARSCISVRVQSSQSEGRGKRNQNRGGR